MRPITLASFIETVSRERRIRFGDVRRLERDVLPEGLASRDEARMLLALDRTVAGADPAWTAFLAAAIRKLLGAGPVEELDPDDAAWLLEALGPRPTKTGTAIAREFLTTTGGSGVPMRRHRTDQPSTAPDMAELATP